MILDEGIYVAPALTRGDAGSDIGTRSNWAIVCIVKHFRLSLSIKVDPIIMFKLRGKSLQ